MVSFFAAPLGATNHHVAGEDPVGELLLNKILLEARDIARILVRRVELLALAKERFEF